jgi:hypothetical protein
LATLSRDQFPQRWAVKMLGGPQRTPTHAAPYAADGNSNFYSVTPASGIDPADYGGSPPEGNRDYITAPGGIGWAPQLLDVPGGTPDPQRIEELPRTDRRANLRDFFGWWKKQDAETAQRESVTNQQAIGWAENKGTYKVKGPHPLWNPPPEPRLTSQLSPHTYAFQRPWDQEIARRFSGSHVSLADNRRSYEILTMRPVTQRRNTYRVEPTPWDTDIVDQPADVNKGRPEMRLSSPDIPTNPRSAYRL